jgi:tRNA(Ile)-lysidine synthase
MAGLRPGAPAMPTLLQRVHAAIRRQQLCGPDTRVLVGLSGGADSVALTVLLRDLAASGGLVLAGAAHVHHGLRPSADRDAEFCRAFAARLGLPLAVERADVRGVAAREGRSLEDTARRLRYLLLARAAERLGADRVAVAHTLDDQAETVLLRLARGAGLTGAAGIRPRRGQVVRPLLGVARAELRAELAARGETWVEDESNADLANPRNRVRHRVLPELDQVLGAPVAPALARAAALAGEDGVWLDAQAAARLTALAGDVTGGLALDAAGLRDEAPPVKRRIVLQALRLRSPDREIGLEHVEAVLAVLEGDRRGADVPGSRVELRTEKLVLLDTGAGSDQAT